MVHAIDGFLNSYLNKGRVKLPKSGVNPLAGEAGGGVILVCGLLSFGLSRNGISLQEIEVGLQEFLRQCGRGRPRFASIRQDAHFIKGLTHRLLELIMRKCHGFTLIELLVVVPINALLIAILLPALSAAREHATRAQCKVNMRSMAAADVLYAATWNDVIPSNSGAQFFFNWWNNHGKVGAQPAVHSTAYLILQNQGVSLPNDANAGASDSNCYNAFLNYHVLQCPAFPNGTKPQSVCYVANAFDPNNWLNPPMGGPDGYLTLKKIARPSDICNFVEGNKNLPTDQFDQHDAWCLTHIQENISSPVSGGAGTPGRILSDDRHNNMTNLSFFDEHVEERKYKTITDGASASPPNPTCFVAR
jgi:prepilin-type N-terminal cleavage/methylation domain-containing protein